MKKILALFLALSMLFTLAACGSSNNQATTPSTEPSQPTTDKTENITDGTEGTTGATQAPTDEPTTTPTDGTTTPSTQTPTTEPPSTMPSTTEPPTTKPPTTEPPTTEPPTTEPPTTEPPTTEPPTTEPPTTEPPATESVESEHREHTNTICVPENGVTYEDAPCNTEGCNITVCVDCGMEVHREYWHKGHVNIVAEFFDIGATCVSEGKFGEHRWCADCNEQFAVPEVLHINPNCHVNFEYINAREATCGEAGYLGDCRCIDCDKIFEGSQITYIPPTGNHIGGTAKCGKQAVCSVCNQPYSEYGSHGETEIRGAYEATCCNGYTGDICCLICNEVVESGTKTEPVREHDLEVLETSKPGYLVWKLSRCKECGTEFITAIKVD